MSFLKKSFSALVSLGFAALVVSCNSTSTTLSSLEITPTTASLVTGNTQTFAVTGVYSDKSTATLPNAQLTWKSSATTIATVSTAGVATAVAPGSATVTVTSGSVSTTATVKVAAAAVVLKSIQVTSAATSSPVGIAEQFTATGIYSDSSHHDLTGTAQWTVSASNSGSFSSSTAGLFMGSAPSSVTITATDSASGISGTESFTVSNAVLSSLAISSPLLNLPVGISENLALTATFSDGSTKDFTSVANWSSSSASDMSVSNAIGSHGVVKALSAESGVQISATDPTSGMSTSITLNATNASLQSISISVPSSGLPKGGSETLTATGSYSDGSTANITNSVTWSSSSADVSVSNASGQQGQVSAVEPGSATISAQLGSTTAQAQISVSNAVLESIAVSGAASAPQGTSAQFSATGSYSDGSTVNLTSSVSWQSSNTSDATISNAAGSNGLAQAVAPGTVTLSATDPISGLSGSASFQVSSGVLQSISISPTSAVLNLGNSQQLSATGNYSDNSKNTLTANVSWSSSDPTIASVSSSGLVTALKTGSVQITALDPSTQIQNLISVTVTGSQLLSIAVSAASSSLAVGNTQSYQALGAYSDNSTLDISSSVTWSSSNTGVATVGAFGLVSAIGAGSTTITATSGSVQASAQLTVNAAELVSIQVTSVGSSSPIGVAEQFTATGIYSDNSHHDLTGSASWSSSGSGSFSASTAGSFVGTKAGSISVTATDSASGISGSEVFTLTSAQLQSLSINGSLSSLPVGLSENLAVTATFSDAARRITLHSPTGRAPTLRASASLTRPALTATCKLWQADRLRSPQRTRHRASRLPLV